MKNAVFCRLLQQELNVPYETSMFWPMLMLHKYWKKPNYLEETELDTNPSLTLAQTLNPIDWWAQFWPFYFQ